MSYTTDKFCGYIQDNKYVFDCSSEELCDKISTLLLQESKKLNIPMKTVVTTARSGGFLFGKEFPLIEISHPTEKFSKLGIFVNGNILLFPYLSLSRELFKKRARGVGFGARPSDGLSYYLNRENLVPAQQEEYWHAQVLACINANID